jgi:hypothetical protein
VHHAFRPRQLLKQATVSCHDQGHRTTGTAKEPELLALQDNQKLLALQKQEHVNYYD